MDSILNIFRRRCEEPQTCYYTGTEKYEEREEPYVLPVSKCYGDKVEISICSCKLKMDPRTGFLNPVGEAKYIKGTHIAVFSLKKICQDSDTALSFMKWIGILCIDYMRTIDCKIDSRRRKY